MTGGAATPDAPNRVGAVAAGAAGAVVAAAALTAAVASATGTAGADIEGRAAAGAGLGSFVAGTMLGAAAPCGMAVGAAALGPVPIGVGTCDASWPGEGGGGWGAPGATGLCTSPRLAARVGFAVRGCAMLARMWCSCGCTGACAVAECGATVDVDKEMEWVRGPLWTLLAPCGWCRVADPELAARADALATPPWSWPATLACGDGETVAFWLPAFWTCADAAATAADASLANVLRWRFGAPPSGGNGVDAGVDLPLRGLARGLARGLPRGRLRLVPRGLGLD